MSYKSPRHARRPDTTRSGGAEGNSRLTSALGAVLLVLLFLEGLTILQIGPLLVPHVFVGVMLLPVIALKVGSTTWRFVKYYWGSPEYRRKGPPPTLLRVLGPVVVILSFAVVLTGLFLVVGAPASLHPQLLQLHQITFVLWFGAMTLHVLGHIVETLTVGPRDWFGRGRRLVSGASWRQWATAGIVVVGLLAGLWSIPHAQAWHFFAH